MSQDTSIEDREVEASHRLAAAIEPATIYALLADAKRTGTPIDGVDGLLNQMTKAVIECALQAEITHELGYERDDPAGAGSGNSRNGFTAKTVSTPNGPVTINVPRDRNGVFEPRIVPKHARRLGQIDDMILSLYSRGMTTRDIEAHLREVYGVAASRELISKVTDVVTDEIEMWRNRPVDEVYPIVYIDGLRIKVRDQGAVTVKVAYLVIGVDVEGRKHALGIWIAETEGAKFWLSVLTELRNRGLRDILICCCDGLTGLPEAITTAFPNTVVQTCVVHYADIQIMPNTPREAVVVPGRQGGRGCPGRHNPSRREARQPRPDRDLGGWPRQQITERSRISQPDLPARLTSPALTGTWPASRPGTPPEHARCTRSPALRPRRVCDYADFIAAGTAPTSTPRPDIGITPMSG